MPCLDLDAGCLKAEGISNIAVSPNLHGDAYFELLHPCQEIKNQSLASRASSSFSVVWQEK